MTAHHTSLRPDGLRRRQNVRATVLADSSAGRVALALAMAGRVTVKRLERNGMIVLEIGGELPPTGRGRR